MNFASPAGISRVLAVTLSLLWLSGCTAMLMGGGGATGAGAGTQTSDGALAQQVRSALHNHGIANVEAIDITVSRQVVTLRGVVSSAEQRVRAAEIAGRVDNVAAVRNYLRVPAD